MSKSSSIFVCGYLRGSHGKIGFRVQASWMDGTRKWTYFSRPHAKVQFSLLALTHFKFFTSSPYCFHSSLSFSPLLSISFSSLLSSSPLPLSRWFLFPLPAFAFLSSSSFRPLLSFLFCFFFFSLSTTQANRCSTSKGQHPYRGYLGLVLAT